MDARRRGLPRSASREAGSGDWRHIPATAAQIRAMEALQEEAERDDTGRKKRGGRKERGGLGRDLVLVGRSKSGEARGVTGQSGGGARIGISLSRSGARGAGGGVVPASEPRSGPGRA